MDFDFTNDQVELREAVAAFARAELGANLLEEEKAGHFSRAK